MRNLYYKQLRFQASPAIMLGLMHCLALLGMTGEKLFGVDSHVKFAEPRCILVQYNVFSFGYFKYGPRGIFQTFRKQISLSGLCPCRR